MLQQWRSQICNIQITEKGRTQSNRHSMARREVTRENWQTLWIFRPLKQWSKILCSFHWVPSYIRIKYLPLHLKYVYLGDNNILLVIISSSLNANQDKSLVDVLGRYKKAIEWTMTDIKGINPSICMHKILLEDCYSNFVEQQRRLMKY